MSTNQAIPTSCSINGVVIAGQTFPATIAGATVSITGNGAVGQKWQYTLYDASAATWKAIGTYSDGKLPAKLEAGRRYSIQPRYISGPPTPPPLKVEFSVAPALAATPVKPAAPIDIAVVDADRSDHPVTTSKWPAIGAVIDFTYDCKAGYGAKAVAAGLTVVRSFLLYVDKGSVFNPHALDAVKAMLTANPTLTAVVLITPSQGSTPSSLADIGTWQTYLTALAASLIGYEGRIFIELFNEPNNNVYLPMGQQINKVSPPVVAYVISVLTLARLLMPKVYIIGPSIGYDADPQVHIDYAKAWVAAGLLTLINGYNDHFYPTSATAFETALAGVAAVVGPVIDRWLTEVNFPRVRGTSYATDALPYIVSIRTHGFRPVIYRGLPHSGDPSESTGQCVYGADGNVRPGVVAAWATK